jgi:DNA-binding NarL/FixJ family response regulator
MIHFLSESNLKRALFRVPGCHLIGMATDGIEALSMIRLLRPDVVLLDLSMPFKSGIEVLGELRHENSDVIIIMFTADSTPGLKEKCLRDGANYFVCKTEFQQLTDIFVELQRD